MKKAYKITWISLASIIGLIIIVLEVGLCLLLNSDRLTALVNKYASEFITCEYKIGKVDLTLFSTFPDVGLEIDDLVLINPTEGCDSDTVAAIDRCIVSVNIKKLMNDDEIIINTCELDGGYINVFYAKDGSSNIDIFPPSDEELETTEEEGSYSIDLDKLKLNNVNLIYTDLAENTTASVDGFCMNMKGKINDDIIAGDLSLTINNMLAEISDSTMMKMGAQKMAFKGNIEIKGDDISTDADIAAGKLAFLMQDEESIAGNINDLSMKYNGVISNYEYLKGIASFKMSNTTLALDNEKYIDNAEISLNSPIEVDINKYAIAFGMVSSSLNLPINYDANKYNAKFEGSKFKYNNIIIDLVGEIAMADDIKIKMDVETNDFLIPELIEIIPESMREELLGGINANGTAQLKTHIEGVLNDELVPIVIADVVVKDGFIEMKDELPYPISKLNTDLHANLNLNNKSDIIVNKLDAKMNNSTFELSGNIDDVLDKMLCNLKIKTDFSFNDVKYFMPDELIASGKVKANLSFKGSVEQLENLDLMKTRMDGKLQCKDLNISYSDTINIVSSDLKFNFVMPNPAKNNLKNGLAQVNIEGSDLNADITGMMTAVLDDFNIGAQVSNILDDNETMAVIADFDFRNIDFEMDDMEFYSDNATGSAFMLPSVNEGNISYTAVYSSDSLVFSMGNDLFFAAEALAMDICTDYDEKEEDVLLQWNPILNLNVSSAVIETSELEDQIVVPDIDLSYNEAGLDINNSQIVLGNSDFTLQGTLTNIYDHFKNDELLKGEFTFTSDYTDVNELMDIFNGMGTDEEVATNDTIAQEDDPFMVPMGVEFVLHTLINSASAGKMEIHNVGGDLTIKDGILVLQEMGFTSDAAKMQLTALYKSKRKNHLYAGIDFHLLDIDIAEMIRIIPDLDTIVPMLSSFAGQAEFHFAAETNMKSDYSLKYSTLKAACSIEGQDLVVLDTETFDMIKKKLFFSKKTTNKIDSLDVQFTVFKNEIDVYPFAISMDKYSAMLYGRHNLDMSYDYNIAVLSPPILSRLGLEIKGPDFDHMKFKVRRSRHRNLFKPEKRDYKEEKIAEIKKIISNSLKDNVK